MMKRGISWMCLSLASLGLGGCEGSRIYNDEKYNVTYQQQHPIVLEHKAMDLVIPVGAEKKGFRLNDEELQKVKVFARGAMEKGEGKVLILAPKGGLNEKNMKKALDEAQKMVVAGGVKKTEIEVQRPVVEKDTLPPLRFSYERFVASAPNCSDAWSRNTADAYRNTRWKGLGCASQSNLAAMMSNPKDLVEMRPLGEGSGARREKAMENFYEGTTTSASRGASETASASTSSGK